jgi:hypothetical protein
LTLEEYKTFRRGLDEITFNLQESQDFFEASLDGRLKQYQQLEKCMIEAQLQVLAKYPESSQRRQVVETELKKDLQYITEHMQEDPKVTRHRQHMRQIHQDFFAVLKWQREHLIKLLAEHPEEIVGLGEGVSVEELREEFSKLKGPSESAPPKLEMKCPVTGKVLVVNENAGGAPSSELQIKNLYEGKELK